MYSLNGKTVFAGIAIGKIELFKKEQQSVRRYTIDDIDSELKRVNLAKGKTISQLKTLYEKALIEVGESGAMIFEIHQMIILLKIKK